MCVTLSGQEALVRDVLAVGWAGLDSDDLYPRRLRDLIARAAE